MSPQPGADAGPVEGRSATERTTLRLGVIDYLNMQPLIAGLESMQGEGLELRYGVPSRLARWMEEGTIDLGMLPVAAVAAHPDWRVVLADPERGRGSMIGARGPVGSVQIIGTGDPQEWRRLHPDSHSVTSNALARVILERRYGVRPELAPPTPPADWELPEAPAAGEGYVLIGSRALRWRKGWGPGGTVLDLGHEWCEWTGLPFVFAVWAARPGVELGDWPARLEAHKRANMGRLAELAGSWPGLAHDRLTAAEAQRYLTENVNYELDGTALAGMARYIEEARSLGVLPGV